MHVEFHADLAIDGTHVRIIDEHTFLETLCFHDELEGAPSKKEFVHQILLQLAEQWQVTFNTVPVKVVLPEEGEMWAVHYDNTIDGEVVQPQREIESGQRDTC